MQSYNALSYFLLLNGVEFALGTTTQYNGFHNPLFSTLVWMCSGGIISALVDEEPWSVEQQAGKFMK